jgi:hypothetical protein
VSRALRAVWEFVVGDDWRVAAGIAVAFALSAALASAGLAAWWAIPACVVVVLTGSVVAVGRRRV